jgi:tetratricopeptide (TPR) repeat protein
MRRPTFLFSGAVFCLTVLCAAQQAEDAYALPLRDGAAATAKGNLSAAMAAIQVAMALRSNNAGGWSKLGHVSLAFVVGAILAGAVYPRAVQANGTNAEFARLLQAGTTESLRGDLVHATADLEEAVALEPQSAEGWFQLGLLYSKATSFRKAEATFRKAVELDPHFAEAHFRLGWTLIIDPPSKLDWAGAITQCRAALADKPDYADALDLLGTGLTNLGELEKAVEVLQQATVIKPASAATHFNLALALEKLGRLEQARGEYEAAIAARNDYPEVHSALGKLLLTMGEPSEAEQELRKALQLNPDLGDAHYALARAMQALKETTAAKIELAESADLTRRQSDANQSVNLSNEGLATATRGDFAGAVKSLREAVALKPDYGVPHFNLGLLLADTGDMTGALRELNVAISLMPGQAKPWFELGRVYERLGDGGRAFEAFSWAARLAPSDTTMQAKVKSLKLAGATSAGELNIPEDTAANHHSAAEALLHDGQPMDAVSESLRALTLAPADVNVRRLEFLHIFKRRRPEPARARLF